MGIKDEVNEVKKESQDLKNKREKTIKQRNKKISKTQESKNKQKALIIPDDKNLRDLERKFGDNIIPEINRLVKYYSENPFNSPKQSFWSEKFKCNIILVNIDASLKEDDEKNYFNEVKDDEGKTKIVHPGKRRLVSEFADEIAGLIYKEDALFFRPESREIVEIGIIDNENHHFLGFSLVSSSRFVTLIERFVEPGVFDYNSKTKTLEWNSKSITKDLANTTLESSNFQNKLKKIKRIFNVPIPIVYNKSVTFPKKGYDERFESWTPHRSPEIKYPGMKLDQAKKIIKDLFKEFCFESKHDYINAIAAFITPFLRGLYSSFNVRTPVFFYKANRERAGKDYCAGITGIIYEGAVTEDPPISSGERNNSSDELRKKLMSAFRSGRKRLHFSNNKGYINNSSFEAIITSPTWHDRILGKSEDSTYDNEFDFSLSGNTGIGLTADLSNRSLFINLFLDIEDANAREFKNPNLHQWVRENRELILSAVYCLVRHWEEKGYPEGDVVFSSFPEWARICGGIMKAAGYDSPNNSQQDLEIGGDLETLGMKSLFEWMYTQIPDTFKTKKEIMDYIQDMDYPVMQHYNFDERGDRMRFSKLLLKFCGRILSDIRLVRDSSEKASPNQKFKFTKDKEEVNKELIFEDG